MNYLNAVLLCKPCVTKQPYITKNLAFMRLLKLREPRFFYKEIALEMNSADLKNRSHLRILNDKKSYFWSNVYLKVTCPLHDEESVSKIQSGS